MPVQGARWPPEEGPRARRHRAPRRDGMAQQVRLGLDDPDAGADVDEDKDVDEDSDDPDADVDNKFWNNEDDDAESVDGSDGDLDGKEASTPSPTSSPHSSKTASACPPHYPAAMSALLLAAFAPLASARAFGARAPRPSAVGRCA